MAFAQTEPPESNRNHLTPGLAAGSRGVPASSRRNHQLAAIYKPPFMRRGTPDSSAGNPVIFDFKKSKQPERIPPRALIPPTFVRLNYQLPSRQLYSEIDCGGQSQGLELVRLPVGHPLRSYRCATQSVGAVLHVF